MQGCVSSGKASLSLHFLISKIDDDDDDDDNNRGPLSVICNSEFKEL